MEEALACFDRIIRDSLEPDKILIHAERGKIAIQKAIEARDQYIAGEKKLAFVDGAIWQAGPGPGWAKTSVGSLALEEAEKRTSGEKR